MKVRALGLRASAAVFLCASGALGWLACSAFSAEPNASPEDGGVDATPEAGVPGVDSSMPQADGGDAGAPLCADAGVVAEGGCPEPIAVGQDNPLHVVVAGSKVFWSNFGSQLKNGKVMSANLDGSGADEFGKSQGRYPKFLAVADGYVYWGAQEKWDEDNAVGSVRRQPVGGGTVEEFASTSGGYTPRAIAANATDVYWVTWSGSRIRAPLDGGMPVDLGGGGVLLIDLHLDDNTLFSTQAGNAGSNPGSIQGYSLKGGGGSPSLLLTGINNYPWGIRANTNTVYWTERGTPDGSPVDGGPVGNVSATARGGGGTVKTLCSQLASPLFLDVDNTHIYFTVEGFGESDGALQRVRSDGTSACEVLVSGLARPHGIRVTETHVYWTTRGDGRVWRMKKP